MQPRGVSRRTFLKASAAFAVPAIVPARALGKGGVVGANDRILVGVIGTGGRGQWLAESFIRQPDAQVVAVCDVDRGHLDAAKQKVEAAYAKRNETGYGGCAAYRDFRELVAREDLDAVVVGTPDHWHAIPTIAALRAGKHVYCEKPLANTIPEGRAMAQAARDADRRLQVGSHERSTANCRLACELVRGGRLGEVRTIRINLPCSDGHHQEARKLLDVPSPEPVPEGFDYDFWLGHTPAVPYTPRRCHFWWRFNLAYGGGEMTDRGAHVLDIAQLGADLDATGPVAVEATGVRNAASLYNTYWDYRFAFRYANGVQMIGTTDGPRGLKFEGSKGWIFVNIHGGKLEAEPASLLTEALGPNDVQLGRTPSHQRNFLDAIRGTAPLLAPVEAGHRTASLCHLANVAMTVGRPLQWDPVAERIVGDDAADGLLRPAMRQPWRL